MPFCDLWLRIVCICHFISSKLLFSRRFDPEYYVEILFFFRVLMLSSVDSLHHLTATNQRRQYELAINRQKNARVYCAIITVDRRSLDDLYAINDHSVNLFVHLAFRWLLVSRLL